MQMGLRTLLYYVSVMVHPIVSIVDFRTEIIYLLQGDLIRKNLISLFFS